MLFSPSQNCCAPSSDGQGCNGSCHSDCFNFIAGWNRSFGVDFSATGGRALMEGNNGFTSSGYAIAPTTNCSPSGTAVQTVQIFDTAGITESGMFWGADVLGGGFGPVPAGAPWRLTVNWATQDVIVTHNSLDVTISGAAVDGGVYTMIMSEIGGGNVRTQAFVDDDLIFEITEAASMPSDEHGLYASGIPGGTFGEWDNYCAGGAALTDQHNVCRPSAVSASASTPVVITMVANDITVGVEEVEVVASVEDDPSVEIAVPVDPAEGIVTPTTPNVQDVCAYASSDGSDHTDDFSSGLTGWTETAGDWDTNGSNRLEGTSTDPTETRLILNRLTSESDPSLVIVEVLIYDVSGDPSIRISDSDTTTDFRLKAEFGSSDYTWDAFGSSGTITGSAPNDGDKLTIKVVKTAEPDQYDVCFFHQESLLTSKRGNWSQTQVYHGLELDVTAFDTGGDFDDYTSQVDA